MTTRTTSLRVVTNPRPPVVPSAVLGMLLFLFTEMMLFAGLVSAHSIARAGALLGWPPPGQPRLPFEETALNTAALILSGALLIVAQWVFARDKRRTRPWLTASIALGAFFVVFQGVEWVGLIREGLTLTSSTHGAFFYVIIGIHALHAVAALIVLGMNWLRLQRGILAQSTFAAGQAFWYFVVGVWPILYWRVYT